MGIKKPETKRNVAQYSAFRRAFRKWFDKYRVNAVKAVVNTESCTLYDKKKKMIATYFAPDKVKYMKWIAKGLR